MLQFQVGIRFRTPDRNPIEWVRESKQENQRDAKFTHEQPQEQRQQQPQEPNSNGKMVFQKTDPKLDLSISAGAS